MNFTKNLFYSFIPYTERPVNQIFIDHILLI